jgi:hypothetical protein
MIRVELGTEIRPGAYEWRCLYAGHALEGVSSEPLLDACRAIKRAGASTAEEISLFREGRSDWDLKCQVGWGAEHTVIENRKAGPLFGKWRPFPSELQVPAKLLPSAAHAFG